MMSLPKVPAILPATQSAEPQAKKLTLALSQHPATSTPQSGVQNSLQTGRTRKTLLPTYKFKQQRRLSRKRKLSRASLDNVTLESLRIATSTQGDFSPTLLTAFIDALTLHILSFQKETMTVVWMRTRREAGLQEEGRRAIRSLPLHHH